MKTLLRLAVLALAGTAALALAGNALATQKLSVTSDADVAHDQGLAGTDGSSSRAKITIYVPTGYTLNTSAAPGTNDRHDDAARCSHATRTSRCRSSGDVVVDTADARTRPAATRGTHLAVWNLQPRSPARRIDAAGPRRPDGGRRDGARRVQARRVPRRRRTSRSGTPGPLAERRAAARRDLHGQQHLHGARPGRAVWKAITTPWRRARGVPNPAGTVETRVVRRERRRHDRRAGDEQEAAHRAVLRHA